MPAPDVQYFLDCSIECGHIAGDVHHYFMEVATDSNEVLDAYDAEGRTFPKHWSSLADTGLYMERNFIAWRAKQAPALFEAPNPDNIRRYQASFMGLWSARPLIDAHLSNAASIMVEAGHTSLTGAAMELVDREFEFSLSMGVAKRALNRAAADFDGWEFENLRDMRLMVERQRHDDQQRQIDAINRIRAQIGTGLISAESIMNKLGPLTSAKEIKKAKQMIADRVQRERGIIKRSTRFLTKLVGGETTRLYVGGHAVRIEGRHAVYELKKRSGLLDAHGGFAALAVFDKDHPDLHLCDVCIFTRDVPLLDHVASIIMHIQTGHEEDIVSIGNPANCSDAAYEREWLVPHLPNRDRTIDLTGIMRASRPAWAAKHEIKDKQRKINRILRDLRGYAYEEVYAPHRKMLADMRQVTGQVIPFYLEDYGAANHDDPAVLPLAPPTANVRAQAEAEVTEAMDIILAQLPQPGSMDHARDIEEALERIFDDMAQDEPWIDAA